jgi:hypothetical protein
MRKLILAATLMIAGLAGGAANAMPIGSSTVLVPSNVVTVDYACGRGYHLSPRGYCRPNRWAPPPRPRYYSHRWDRRDHWHRRGPPRHWGYHRNYRRW